MLELYENIKKYRKARKLSQEELAKRTGYNDRSSIAKIESGVVDLSYQKISVFADALGVTAATLMGNDGIVPEQQESDYFKNYCICAPETCQRIKPLCTRLSLCSDNELDQVETFISFIESKRE